MFLFCTLVMITDMFCIILYPCHNHRHVLYYFVPLSWSQTCFVLFCTLVMITDMFCIIVYPCHDHRHVLYYFVNITIRQKSSTILNELIGRQMFNLSFEIVIPCQRINIVPIYLYYTDDGSHLLCSVYIASEQETCATYFLKFCKYI